jgi:hypothetical protein
MTADQAQALVPGDKIQYVDGRMATVVTNNATAQEVSITFDDDTEDPKPVAEIKYWDFVRAEKFNPATMKRSKVRLVFGAPPI